MPDNPLYMKRTKMGSYEKSDQYKEEIRKKTTPNAIRDARNSMMAKSSGMNESFAAVLNYLDDAKRKRRFQEWKKNK